MIVERTPIFTKHITSDGKQWDTPEEAMKAQRYLDYAAALNKKIGGSPCLKIGENILYNAMEIYDLVGQYLAENKEP